jgi:hypothetical protein
MIKVSRLKELLASVPEDADVYAYDGEDTGIGISASDGIFFWIRAKETLDLDTYTEGFKEE